MQVNGKVDDPGRSTPSNDSWYPLRRTGGFQNRSGGSGWSEHSFAPAGIRISDRPTCSLVTFYSIPQFPKIRTSPPTPCWETKKVSVVMRTYQMSCCNAPWMSLHLQNTTVASGYHLVTCVYGENFSEFSQSSSHSAINYGSREEIYLLGRGAV
jgi:hypothetical protein